MTRFECVQQLAEKFGNERLGEEILQFMETVGTFEWDAEDEKVVRLRELNKYADVRDLKDRIERATLIGYNYAEFESISDQMQEYMDLKEVFNVREKKDYNKPGNPVVALIVEWL